jgi:acetylornithine deacetylase
MDVVPANPEEWERDPYKLTREGDILYGRGSTDCLGHVALITELFVELATRKPKLTTTIVAVFIANEENSEIPDIGVDGLIKNGKLAHLKKGYMYWIDASDMHPCIGTAACASWKLKVTGLQGHSGLPNKAINALLLGYEAVSEICKRFHEAFPAHPKETDYKFACPTNMKLTMVEHPPGAVNQIPGQATFQGDIRVTTFYTISEVMEKTTKIAEEVKNNILSLPTRGPLFGYQVGEKVASFEFDFAPGCYKGIACDINSPGFTAFHEATKSVIGESNPYSIGGSLPLVWELQQEGYDLQIAGYGLSAKYHGTNEYAKYSDMEKGFKILQTLIGKLNSQ